MTPHYTYFHATAATGAIVKPGTGTLASVAINKALTGTVTLKDGTTTIAVITNSSGPIGTVIYGGGAGGVQFGTNLNVSMTTAAEDITISYE